VLTPVGALDDPAPQDLAVGSKMVEVPVWLSRDPMMVSATRGEASGTEGAADIREDMGVGDQCAESTDLDRTLMLWAQ
jgi:hypothetical protein